MKNRFVNFKKCMLLIAALATCVSMKAQDTSHNIMYKKTIVRAMDLREKQNKGIYSRNNEITRWILNAAKKGRIKLYSNDSLTTTLSLNELDNRLIIPNSGINLNNPADTMNAFMTYGDTWRDYVTPYQEYLPKDLYQLEMKEEVVFDNNRSRMQSNIQTLTLYVPADHPSNLKGIQMPIASFDYKEVEAKVFSEPYALWYNSSNEAEHKTLADAFELRLFSSYIIKVGNANDAYLADVYNSQEKGIIVSKQAEMNLLEFEHNLWEF